jgi:G3E family GTPase
VLIIESTGVANPSDLKRDLKLPIFDDRFRFVEQFCILDAAHFLDAYDVYASLEKQIASSTVFIINKTDLAPIETIDRVKKVVHEFHPDPYFFETTYADIPLEQFLFPEEAAAKVDEESVSKKYERRVLSENELDAFVDDLLDDPDLEITPPDRLLSVTYRWSGDDLEQVREMAGRLPSSVVRAKGFLEEKGGIFLFNYVMGDWTLEKSVYECGGLYRASRVHGGHRKGFEDRRLEKYGRFSTHVTGGRVIFKLRDWGIPGNRGI